MDIKATSRGEWPTSNASDFGELTHIPGGKGANEAQPLDPNGMHDLSDDQEKLAVVKEGKGNSFLGNSFLQRRANPYFEDSMFSLPGEEAIFDFKAHAEMRLSEYSS